MNLPHGPGPEFRMSSFVALHNLRRYLQDHPGTASRDAAESLQRIDADLAAADFEGALRLHSLLPESFDFAVPSHSIRDSLAFLIEMYKPWWYRFFPYGRQRIATALTQDERQTFRSAGLFEDAPDDNVVAWWDRFASMARTDEADLLGAQGRYAEKLSFELEIQRLKTLGVGSRPRWVALDDNSAGYDIQSYQTTKYGLKNVLIEVKSSCRSSPRIIITRGEWEVAKKYGDAYIFHFWALPKEELRVLTVDQVAQHIPADQGDGSWAAAEIEL
jgi:hypothetical protein